MGGKCGRLGNSSGPFCGPRKAFLEFKWPWEVLLGIQVDRFMDKELLVCLLTAFLLSCCLLAGKLIPNASKIDARSGPKSVENRSQNKSQTRGQVVGLEVGKSRFWGCPKKSLGPQFEEDVSRSRPVFGIPETI